MKRRFYFYFAILLLVSSSIVTNAQTGGQFTIEKSVIATGGGTSSGGAFKIEGTSGQAAAGTHSTNSAFDLRNGFWTPEQFAPTAALVTVSGRVTTNDGRGIRNVRVILNSLSGETRTALTSAFGYFQFTDVPVGETYIFSILAKRFQFEQPMQIRTVLEEISDVHFIGYANQ